MTDMSIPKAVSEADSKPGYESPSVKEMDQNQVLEAFQMTATEISAAGTWWNTC